MRYFKENLFIVVVSFLFGIATHILWDNFTHERGQFVQAIGELKKTFTVAGFSISVYKFLQYSSTIIGGVIIIYALLQLPKEKNFERQKSIFHFWFLVGAIALIIVAGRLLTGLDYKLYSNVIVTAITGGLVGLVLTPKLIALKI